MTIGEELGQLIDRVESAEKDYQAAHYGLMNAGRDAKTRRLALERVLRAHSQRQVAKRQLIQYELLTPCNSGRSSLAMVTGG